MIRAPLALACLLALPLPALASSEAAPDEAADKEPAADPYAGLPRTLIPQGIIGRMTFPDGLALLDQDILNRMRERLRHVPRSAGNAPE